VRDIGHFFAGHFEAVLEPALPGDEAKESPFFVVLPLEPADIGRHRNSVVIQEIDHSLIIESERTARDTIVSDTSQGMTVHCPDEQRLLVLCSQPTAFPEFAVPVDLRPTFAFRFRAASLEEC